MPSIITAGDLSVGLVVTSSNDGAITIQSGLAGAKVNAVVAAADGTLTFLRAPLNTAVQSMVRLNTANGYGSTNTVIRRFTNVVTNQGADITYADSATLGATFTINTNGVYAVTQSINVTSDSNQGLSLNSSQLATNIVSITAADRLAITRSGAGAGGNIEISCGCTLYLPSGSVIRSHGDGVGSTTAANCHFTITRVA